MTIIKGGNINGFYSNRFNSGNKGYDKRTA